MSDKVEGLKCVMLSLLISLLPVKVFAEISSQTNYYPIIANTAKELDAQLSQKNRNGFHADTQWRIQPRYRFKKMANGCEVAESNINLTVTYTMPEWQNKKDASAELQEKWNRWYANLLSHEENHGFNGRQAYNDIKQGIYLMESTPTCSQLTQAINAMIDSTLFKYSQEDTFYDQRTQHGATEGTSIQFSAKK